MKRLLCLLILCALVSLSQVSDVDKLKIREAELVVAESTARRNAAESAYYQALRATEQAQAALDHLLSEVSARSGCDPQTRRPGIFGVDPKTAECIPTPNVTEK